MTSQRVEQITFEGRPYHLLALPLEPLFTQRPRPFREWSRTSLYRCYVGIWEVRDGQLWLLDLEEAFVDEVQGLACVFRDAAPPIAADWFSGTLFLEMPIQVRGKPEELGYGGEPKLALEISRGRLVGRGPGRDVWEDFQRAANAF
jgi:hypothetical protein